MTLRKLFYTAGALSWGVFALVEWFASAGLVLPVPHPHWFVGIGFMMAAICCGEEALARP